MISTGGGTFADCTGDRGTAHTRVIYFYLIFSEQNLERQVLQTQCRRLEAQHYSLSLTAEQLSHSMAVSLHSPDTQGGEHVHSPYRPI
jgi:hypothetical protein